MTKNEKLLLKMIYKYCELLGKQEEVIKYLFNHTELFEQPYINDFPEELFRFFAGKIGTEARQKNKLYALLTPVQLKELKEIEILEN